MTDSAFSLISPADLGLPVRFDRFRQTQREALDWFQSSDSAVMAAQLPTGSGKSLFGAACAALTGGKATDFVVTKALQGQLLRDFEPDMRDIRGRANYECTNYKNCDDGFDNDCSLSNTNACPYTRAVTTAQQSLLVVSNYAYWLYSNGVRNKAFEGTQLLICDEAHNIESQLSGFASVKVYARELKLHGGTLPFNEQSGVMSGDEAVKFINWCREALESIDDSDKEDKDPLSDRCRRITKMGANWVWQFDDRGHVTFEPIRLSGFTSRLFAGVPRVLLMSASLSEFTLKLLLPPDLAYEYRAWPPVFPQDHAPVYHIPTVKLNWKSTDEDYKLVIERADQIIDGRTDRKGIVHTVSYARTKRILQHSRHSRRFIWNEDSSSLGKSLELFRQSSDRILVTPSVEEGFDFAGSACEYQIVLKFPFPNETQRVIKERCAQIPGYRLHYAAQKIVQMRGRPIRSYHDRAEMFVLDNSVKQLSGPEGRSYLPSGFRIFTVNAIPPAPPKIRQSDIREET
jgi:Rad3-related DNA helicase